MKTVLVPLLGSDNTATLLSAAAAVGKQFDSLIEGFCFKPTYLATAYFEAGSPAIDERFEQEYRAQAASLRDRFFDRLEAEGISKIGGPTKPGQGGARWVDQVESGYGYITYRARLFDLVIVSGGAPTEDHFASGVFEAALFETGRPVLVMPPSEIRELGSNVVIVWNGSDESVRALVLAMPFLRKASRVFVLSVEGATVPGPHVHEVAEYLAHQGIESEARHVHPKRVSAGQAIVEESEGLGADLLVKGAYTHSRLRQMIFGGPTRHILEHATVPVLMAH